MLIGQGAREAATEVLQAADLLGAGVAKALLGKDAVPDDLPIVTGALGLLGTEPSHKMMMNCDTLFMIGTSFPYAEWLPKEGQAKCVEIDIDGSMIGVRYPNDVSLVGDSKDTLQGAAADAQAQGGPLLAGGHQGGGAPPGGGCWTTVRTRRATRSTRSCVFHELNKRLPDDCIMTSDSGSATNWWARYVQIREGMRGSLSGTLATMVPGRALRHRRQVRLPGAAGHRLHR